MSPMPRPPTNTVRDAHGVLPHEVCVLPNLHRPTQLLRVRRPRPAVEPTETVTAGDAGPAGTLGDAVCADVELISGAMAFFAALWGRGVCGFCGVDEERG